MSDDSVTTIFGFAIPDPPPSPSGDGHFATAQPPQKLSSAQSTIVPLQSVSYPGGASKDQFSQAKLSGDAAELADHLYLGQGASVFYNLVLPSPVAVTLSIVMAVETLHNSCESVVAVDVNSKRVFGEARDNNAQYHTVLVDINPIYLVAGDNSIRITSSPDHSKTPLWIQSVSVVSASNTISASYFWQSIYAHRFVPGEGGKYTFSYISGKAETDEDAYTFAETVGVKIDTGDIGEALGGISAELSASFTATQSTKHTISVTQQDSSSDEFDYPAVREPTTVQIWQVCIQFDCNGKTLTQQVDPTQGGVLFSTSYPPGQQTQIAATSA